VKTAPEAPNRTSGQGEATKDKTELITQPVLSIETKHCLVECIDNWYIRLRHCIQSPATLVRQRRSSNQLSISNLDFDFDFAQQPLFSFTFSFTKPKITL
jgi:hypothetical protein